ncbi:Uncharacterised protein [Pragia fontium]|uniref:Phosphoenolpyruvate synthase n=2 Tax=Pragia fontium TaxID=82985 RepID=A0ABQ5LEP7_9GAMM|nr:phosphoenolpyruvate synthase [Pragia fontium]SUB82111.1 Uncharacterised protein [Pragia fontium]
MGPLVVVGRYSFPLEAQIAKSNLQAAGIRAYIADEHTINMQWLYSDALGGVRLMVAEQDAQEAEEILQQDFSLSIAETEIPDSDVESDWICPACGSHNVALFTKGKKSAFVIFILLGFPLFFYQHGVKCNDCGKFSKK